MSCDHHYVFAILQVGSKAPLKLGSKSVWKLDDTVEAAWTAGNDDEIIDSDQLLDDDDLKKPEQESLRGKLPYKWATMILFKMKVPIPFMIFVIVDNYIR